MDISVSHASARHATDAGGVKILCTYITLYTLSHHGTSSRSYLTVTQAPHACVKARSLLRVPTHSTVNLRNITPQGKEPGATL